MIEIDYSDYQETQMAYADKLLTMADASPGDAEQVLNLTFQALAAMDMAENVTQAYDDYNDESIIIVTA